MKIKHYFFAMLAMFFCISVHATTDDPTDNAHFGFIENKGQIHDQNGNARSDIRFLYYNDDFKLILTNSGFSYEFVKTDYLQPGNSESGTPAELEDENEVEYRCNFTTNRIDIDLEKPNKNAQITAEGSSPFYRNYFNEYTGAKGIKRIHSFSKVTYSNIYNGIDLVFSSELNGDGSVYPKYEFIVHPSGNISDIAMTYKGDFQFNMENGGLKLSTGLGYVQETQPVILFSSGRPSEKAVFVRRGNTISFSGIRHQPSETITIDPTVEWGTYWGGIDKDLTDEITVDLNNNAIVTGRTRSSSNFATAGAYQSVWAGALDIPLMKWDPAGNLVYATYYGGHDNEIGFCVTVDPFNQIWIGGHTFSTSGIATPDALVDHFVGPNYDVVLAKFSNDGDLIYGTYMGGIGEDEFQNIWADTDGSIYCSGFAESLDGIIFSPCFQCTGDTAGAVILCKFDNYGNQIWATYWAGQERDRGHGVTVFGNNVYQCGTLESNTVAAYGNPPGNGFKAVNSGLDDIMLGRWNKYTGTPYWITYFGGAGDERGRDIRCDLDGNVYFVGQTESGSDGLATPGAWKQGFVYSKTNRDAIIAKFDSNCNKLNATYFGGNNIDFPRSLRVGAEGAPIYIAGYTKSDSGVVTSDAYDKKNTKNNDAFWARLNWDMSSLQYCTYYGGKKSESITEPGWYGPTMEVDANNNVYLSSGTDSKDAIATANAYKDTLAANGQYDFFLAKFNDPCPDGFEPNDNFATATQLKFRNSVEITHYAPIQVKSDKDYYFFKSPDGMFNLKITLSDLPFDYNLFIYDSLQNQIGKSVNSGLISESVVVNNSYTGKYYVLVKSSSGSFGNVCYTLKVSASALAFRQKEQSALGTLSIFPNPADRFTDLQFDCKNSGKYQIAICDLQGKNIVAMEQQLNEGVQSISLPIAPLSSGTYLVKLTGKGMNDFVKLIIDK